MQISSGGSIARSLGFALVAAMLFPGPCAVQADLVVNIPDVTVFSDGVNPIAGEFEVFLTLTGQELAMPPAILSFNLTLGANGSGLTFATPVPATTTPLFTPSNSNFTAHAMSNQPHAADDANASAVAFNQAGLATFPFTIAAGTPIGTTYTLSLVGVTEFGDAMGNAFANVDFSDTGLISVAAIPEPAAWMGLALVSSLTAAVVFIYRRARRRCRAAA
jgi:hypothetical protein